MRTILTLVCIAMILAGVLLLAVGCATEEDIELAKMQRADAEARRISAQAGGTVNIIQAETDAHIQKTRADFEIVKSSRQFDADLARQQFATALLEIQALQIALQQTREIVEPLGYDAHVAASNSWWTLILLPVGAFVILIGIAGLAWNLAQGLEKRLARIEEAIDEQDVAKKGSTVRE